MRTQEDCYYARTFTKVSDSTHAGARGAPATPQHLLHRTLRRSTAGPPAAARAPPSRLAQYRHGPPGRLYAGDGQAVAPPLADYRGVARCAPGRRPTHLHGAPARTDHGARL